MKKLIISIEDGIVIGIYTDVKEPLNVTIIDSDDYYNTEMKEEFLLIEKSIEDGVRSGEMVDLLCS